jgi:hypothetical protein
MICTSEIVSVAQRREASQLDLDFHPIHQGAQMSEVGAKLVIP